MLILPQKIKTKWNSKHKKYYESKGYIYTKMNAEFEVNVLDLPQTSQIKVQATCDYCNKELTVTYFRANENMKVSCNCCKSKRTKEILGWSSTWELQQTKESIKQTNLKIYGVEHNSYNPETIEKRKQTCLKNYGVTSPLKSKQIQEKIKNNNLKKYGVEYTGSLLSTKNKRKQTNLKIYGVDYVSKLPEIKEKININRLKTMYKNETAPCSKQQKYIHNLVGGELNYPINRCSLDIAFPKEMIYIEYDGGGHNLNVKIGQITQEQFDNHEIKRYQYLKSLGWKLIRITCISDKLLEDNLLLSLINNCKQKIINNNLNWIEINIDNMQIISKMFIKNI